jgi:radical SAM-linked protein
MTKIITFPIRFRFSRREELKYIAHLDMLRVFERALKRCDLPVSHTQGFNPRMKMVFGLPIALGLTSEGEYADIEMVIPVDPMFFMQKLNDNLPPGVRILDAAAIKGTENIMGQIAAARYEIIFLPVNAIARSEMNERIQQLLSADHLPVMKKGKKGWNEIDIRPFVYTVTAAKLDHRQWIIEAFLNAGAKDNIRPELLMEAFHNLTRFEYSLKSLHRKELYASYDNKWVSPLDPSVC